MKRAWHWVGLAIALLVACRDTPTVAPSEAIPTPVAPEASQGDRAQFEALVGRLDQEGWYGIYMMGKKVGHGHLWFRPSRDGEPGKYSYGFDMRMSVSGGGMANELTLAERRFYGADYPHPLIQTTFATGAKGFVDARTGTVKDGQMHITRVLGTTPQPERSVPASKEDLVAQLRLSPLELDASAIGKVSKVSFWTWEKEADESITILFEGIDERMRAGIAERIGRIKMTYDATGVSANVLVGGDGTMIEMTLGASLLLKLEERAVAESGIAGLDILGTGVASPTRLGRPDLVDKLVLEVSGPKDLKLAASSVREVEALPSSDDRGRWRLTLRRGFGDVVTPEARAEALLADATIDLAHPAIVARATELTANAKTAPEKVRAIADWVFRTLDKKLATHLPTASMILDQKVGDCTEHTWLSIALLRAVGVPARPLYGIAYTGDGDALFAYHAWVEVAVPDDAGVERWLAIDPTWGEAQADATHISLGSSLGEVAGSIGGLTIDKATK